MIQTLIDLQLWPSMLSLSSAIILLLSSVATSALTAAIGLGGGLVMLGLLGSFLPVALVIPLHGVIQLGSNSSRAILLRKHIAWPIVLYYCAGAIAGALLGGQFVIALDEVWLLLILASFILLLVWGPKPQKLQLRAKGYSVAGVIITFATMFIGATGPLALAVLPRNKMSPQSMSATHGCLMMGQNLLKVSVFFALGFSFQVWTLFLVLMILMGFLGTYCGRFVLNKLPADIFRYIVNGLLTVIALKMLRDAILLLLI